MHLLLAKSMIRVVASLVAGLLWTIAIQNGGSWNHVQAFTATTSLTTASTVVQRPLHPHWVPISSYSALYGASVATTTDIEDRVTSTALKEELLSFLGGKSSNEEDDNEDGFTEETLYADPITKLPLRKRVLPSKQLIVGGGGISSRVQTYEFISTGSAKATFSPTKYIGTSDTYINLLEPYTKDTTKKNEASFQESMQRMLLPFVPIPLRSVVMNNNQNDLKKDESSSSTYIPMRDLFTSPTVSYLYERGWRQGFTQAGFPGVDTESIMAYDYLEPALTGGNGIFAGNGILVDMSCATGLFTRKFLRRSLMNDAVQQQQQPPIIRRLIGADYSDAMLREARQRIDNDRIAQELLYNFTSSSATGKPSDNHDFQLELVRLDVGMIPMRDNGVDALHAGAAMHCWPDIDGALSEIYRVLRPQGGRYFATTFLANYFRNTQQLFSRSNNNQRQIQEQTFQYFQSVEELRALLMKAGFSNDKIQIDVVGPSCVIIRCEK